jgi:hypothetical protein
VQEYSQTVRTLYGEQRPCAVRGAQSLRSLLSSRQPWG